MTILFAHNLGTRWGIFHNFGEDIQTGYVSLHMGVLKVEMLWSK